MSSETTDKSELKRQIRALKSEVQTSLEAKDRLKAKRLRRQVKRLKRATRTLAKAAKPPPAEAKAT